MSLECSTQHRIHVVLKSTCNIIQNKQYVSLQKVLINFKRLKLYQVCPLTHQNETSSPINGKFTNVELNDIPK